MTDSEPKVAEWRLSNHMVEQMRDALLQEVQARAKGESLDGALLSLQVVYDAAMAVVRSAGDAMNEVSSKVFVENTRQQ